MAESSHLLLFLLLILLRSSTAVTSLESQRSNSQFYTTIDALSESKDFSVWAHILSQTNPSVFPLSATVFIPCNNGLLNPNLPSPFDPFTIAYHIVPQQLSFSDLQTFPIGSRLPTLFQDNSILITSNATSHYTLDDIRITHPDFYINGAVSVHGIESVLDYKTYGSITESEDPDLAHTLPGLPELPPVPSPILADPPSPRLDRPADQGGVTEIPVPVVYSVSDSPCFCAEFPIVFLVLGVVFVLKINGYYPVL